jgi:hypothetical protein
MKRSRTFAVTGLQSEAMKVLSSMLLILNGRSRCSWRIAEPHCADVMMVGPDEDARVFAPWNATGKPWVELSEPGRRRLASSHALELPLRIFPLLDLLHVLEAMLDLGTESEQVSEIVWHSVVSSDWRFAQGLMGLSASTAQGSWRRSGALFVRDDAGEFAAAEETLAELRAGTLALDGFEESHASLPNGLVRRPVEELAWYVGWSSEGAGLAPWLDPHAHYQLTCWPDFGTIKADQDQMRLSALLVSRAWSRDQLAASSKIDTGYVTRFLNAAAVSGMLISSAPPVDDAAQVRAGFLSGLIRGIRQRLGIGSRNVLPRMTALEAA